LGKRQSSYRSRCQLVFVTVESIVQCYASGGRFDQSSERWRTRGLEISSGRRRLRYHQSPSTDNSHQEALRTSWRMDIASYEDKSDHESLRIEITERK
jgi:hypothetical protein